MELQDREVTLKIKSRPLRCAYLVRNRDELLDAIALYTHMWGGAANAILPLPENDEELNSFTYTLEWMNPDYIFIPREERSLPVSQVLEKLPILVRPISKVEIQRHIDIASGDLLHLAPGSLSHISKVLSAIYQNGTEDIGIRLLATNNPFNLESALHAGLPTKSYCDYLVQYLGASTFYNLENRNFLFRALLTITKFKSPYDLTLVRTGKSYNFNSYIIETNDEETLCIFLDDGNDVGIATAFWNCRWMFPYNKIFFSRKDFLENIKTYALQIIKFMPYIRAIHITTPFSREKALELCSFLKNIFMEGGKEVLVKINYQDFRFNWIPGTLSSGKAIEITRTVTSEGCVRFDLSTPVGHENINFTFGYDAEVKFRSGRKFFCPHTLVNSHLLTNELWRLDYSETNRENLGKHWLRQDLPIRAAVKGIAGLALPGKECFFFIHPDNVIITRLLKELGFEVKANEHTRYAQGLVKRLGGIGEVTSLINDGGVDIISVLSADRGDREGLNRSKILSALIKKRSFNQEEANKIINQKLKPLLASDLLRRGYSHRCQNCNLKTWFSIEEIREFIECKGCYEREQLPLDDLEFTYKPNELAAQLIREGGLAVLMTAATLRRIPSSSSSLIQFGGDFFNVENKTKFAEVDLFCLTEEALIISECKSLFTKKEADEKEIENSIKEQIERTRESLKKNLDVAKRIGASAIILGVFTNVSNISNLLNIIADLKNMARGQSIGLHLALNGRIHLWGNSDGIEPRKIKLGDLLVEEQALSNEWTVGEAPSHYGGAVGSKGLFDKEILKQWESDLKA
ncbi:hypothetical protein NDI49_11955 [Trichocoleus sp. ST-U3]|uniref:hypothetical protein n=1 Tax=Coleofasciculus sp. FACHB-542 TaxID=2692787 RepID=UPI0016889C47|nr:hypothetical protein [Coleofasciculus sp. FACHB-542]MBD2084352.1 hypothetical protein [Coleofasciculus sp. FACHB-542]